MLLARLAGIGALLLVTFPVVLTVFVRPVNVPHANGLLTGLGCNVDEAGFATVEATGLTSAFGVWAAGNVVDPRAQVITARRRRLSGGDRHQR